MTVQEQIHAAVLARGYREGWDGPEFVARQIAKALEELAEAARCMNWQPGHEPLHHSTLLEAGEMSRWEFDHRDVWQGLTGAHYDRLGEELADVAVPLFVIAQELGIDLVEMAREKATRDVVRGVR
jgi:NTP pyrophosphatase (non-canonical NTP hydrolase)